MAFVIHPEPLSSAVIYQVVIIGQMPSSCWLTTGPSAGWLAGLDLVRKLEICIISISHLTACVLYCVFRSRNTYAVFFVVVRWLVTTTIYPPILRLTESEKPLVCGTELNGAAVVNRPHSPILWMSFPQTEWMNGWFNTTPAPDMYTWPADQPTLLSVITAFAYLSPQPVALWLHIHNFVTAPGAIN